MTDLATRQGASEASGDHDPAEGAATAVIAVDAAGDGGADAPTYAWAPAEPHPKKRRIALWTGIGAGAAAVALVASSLVLIAPGTAVAGVDVGWMTPGAAADAISQRLAETTIVISGAFGDAEVSGADLGATVDAEALVERAFAEHPMWNPTAWNSGAFTASVQLDADAAAEALRAAAPGYYAEPVDAEVAFDAGTASYVATPAVPGSGIDLDALRSALQTGFAAGADQIAFDVVPSEVGAGITSETADATVAQLNGLLDSVGFYVGTERTVAVDRAVAASWLTVTPGASGFEITADAAAIQPAVDGLAAAVNRSPENATVITDSGGNVLQTMAAGQSGREIGDTAGIADAFAAQLGSGNGVYELPVAEVPVTTTTLARNVVVDLSDQRAYFYENGAVVSSTAVSSGLPGHDTTLGSYRITAKLRSQNMGNPDLTKPPYYYTKNVPWVMYFNGDQALHGAYWHNNFGNRMSHGCVNLPVDVAAFLYEWAPMGTEVKVQA